jgi:hypothetical protein
MTPMWLQDPPGDDRRHQQRRAAQATGCLQEAVSPSQRQVGREAACDAENSELTQLATSRRDRLLQAAQKELDAFERPEHEFSKKERRERAAELNIPVVEPIRHTVKTLRAIAGLAARGGCRGRDPRAAGQAPAAGTVGPRSGIPLRRRRPSLSILPRHSA